MPQNWPSIKIFPEKEILLYWSQFKLILLNYRYLKGAYRRGVVGYSPLAELANVGVIDELTLPENMALL